MSLFPITVARGLIGQPLMVYSWEVVIPNLPASLGAFSRSLSLKARAVTIPGQQNAEYATHFGPFVFSHPGKKSYPRKINVTFEETYENLVIDAMKRWSRLVFDESTGRGEPEQAQKSDLWLRFLGPNPEGRGIANAIHAYDVFPVTMPDAMVDYRNDGQLFVDVTFAYNVWEWEPWPS